MERRASLPHLSFLLQSMGNNVGIISTIVQIKRGEEEDCGWVGVKGVTSGPIRLADLLLDQRRLLRRSGCCAPEIRGSASTGRRSSGAGRQVSAEGGKGGRGGDGRGGARDCSLFFSSDLFGDVARGWGEPDRPRVNR